jgi:hypothetical protein
VSGASIPSFAIGVIVTVAIWMEGDPLMRFVAWLAGMVAWTLLCSRMTHPTPTDDEVRDG